MLFDVIDVPLDRFEQLVADALDGIPEELGRYMENVGVLVRDSSRPGLQGLYQGIPLTHRDQYGGLAMPDRITIFRLPILERCRTEEQVVREVTVTDVH